MARAHLTVEGALKDTIPRGSRLVVAVSGGLDSTVLLTALVRLKRLLRASLEVAHVDHALRPSSAQEALIVAKCSAALGLPFHSCRLSARPKKTNLEAWAREKRYAFLEQVRISTNSDFVLTAHHGDDVAETVLMQLLRNRPLGGIARRDDGRHLIRPLLGVRRGALEAYAKRLKLTWCEDESNQDQAFLRNRVRHELIPYLEKNFEPGLVGVLTAVAERQGADGEYLRSEARLLVARVSSQPFGTKGWLRDLVATLTDASEALRWRVVELLFEPVLGFRLGYRLSLGIVRFLLDQGPAPSLPDGVTLACARGGIRIVGLAAR